MDINILLLIAALIIGLIIGWLLARGQASGTISELESRVRTAQTAAESAKLDFTNLQSELAVKDSHINTLNANIGILEEKLRLAERGQEEFTVTIARLQDELRTATTDRPAFEAELRQCHAELDELKAQLAKALAEADELRARIAADETEREIAALRAQFAAETTEEDVAQLQATLTAPHEVETEVIVDEAEVQEELVAPAEPAATTEVAPAADAATQLATAELEARAAALQNEVLSLRDGLATLAFAGAELVAMYEKRTKEYEDRLARLQIPPVQITAETIEQQGVGPVGAMGLVAGGVALAEATQPGEPTLELRSQLAAIRAELDAVVAGKAELETQLHTRTTELEELQKKYDALRADLETETATKASLAAQIDAESAELGDLRVRLSDVEAYVDSLLGPIEVPEGEPAPDLSAKLGLLKARFADLDQTRASLTAQIDAESAELGDLRVRLSDVEADIDAWLRTQLEVPEGEIPTDLQGKLALFKSSVYGLKQAKDGAEARLQESEARLAGLSDQLAKLQTDLDAAAQAKAELEAKLHEKDAELVKLNDQLAAVQGELDATNRSKADLVAQIDSLSTAKADLEARLRDIENRMRQLEEEQQEGRRLPPGTMAVAAGAVTLGVAASGAEREAQADLTTQLEAKDAMIAELNARLEATKNFLEAREVEFGELQAKLEALTATNNELAARLAEAPAPETGDVGELAELRAQLAELQDRLNAAIAERDALKAASEARATATVAETIPDERLTLVREHVKQTKEVAMRAAIEAGGEVRTSECPQDLAMTKGIGSVFEQRLYAAGIGTFWELANLTDDDFKRILELDDRQLLRVDFEAIRTDARRLAVETDSVGRVWQGAEPDDFEPLEGIGSVYERRLYEAGICTYEALANTPIERLMEICPPTKLRKPNYADWIAQARILAQKKQRGG
ncbi:MAG: helix-hairpin-helix domain-containing protein [Candidatus Brachytrichaceae bacterium NZ_4S206]